MTRPRAKLSAGQGWTEFLSRQGSRPEPEDNKDLFDEPPVRILAILNRRITALHAAMDKRDDHAVRVGLPDTIRMVKMTEHLDGHQHRLERVAVIVRWLAKKAEAPRRVVVSPDTGRKGSV